MMMLSRQLMESHTSGLAGGGCTIHNSFTILTKTDFKTSRKKKRKLRAYC